MSSYTMKFCTYENSLCNHTQWNMYWYSAYTAGLYLRLDFQFSVSTFLHMRKLNSLKRVALTEFSFRISIWCAVKWSLCFLTFFCRVCIDPEWAILGGLKKQTKHVQYGPNILVRWFCYLLWREHRLMWRAQNL